MDLSDVLTPYQLGRLPLDDQDLPEPLVNVRLNGAEADFHALKEAAWHEAGYSVLRLHYRSITAP